MVALADKTSIELKAKLSSNVKLFAMPIQSAWHSNMAWLMADLRVIMNSEIANLNQQLKELSMMMANGILISM